MKFAFASALLAVAVFASTEADKTDDARKLEGAAIIKTKMDDLSKADASEADKKQVTDYDAKFAASSADLANLKLALSKQADGVDLNDAEKKALKAYTDIVGRALSLALAGVATLGAVFLL